MRQRGCLASRHANLETGPPETRTRAIRVLKVRCLRRGFAAADGVTEIVNELHVQREEVGTNALKERREDFRMPVKAAFERPLFVLRRSAIESLAEQRLQRLSGHVRDGNGYARLLQ